MNKPWKKLSLASLIVCALLLYELRRSEKDHNRLTEEQSALENQIAAIGKGLVKAEPSEGKAGDEQKAESDATRKAAYGALLAAWQKKYAEFSHRDNLRDVWTSYHEGISKLNLPRDKQIQLLNLLRAREEAGYDAREVANSMGVTDAGEMNRAAANAKAAGTEEITALIGSSDLKLLEDSLEMKTQESQIARGVGADLAMDGIPLTPEQQTRLAQIYADLSKQFTTSSAEGEIPLLSEIQKQQADKETIILEKAAAFLGSEQMADLRNYIDWSNQQAQFYEKSRK
jgi:hypothetical protein